MFLSRRLLLGAFKSFLRGSCLCIRLQLTPSQEWGGSKSAPETQSPTHSLAHSHEQGTWGCCWGLGLCLHRCVCVCAYRYARVCSRVG